MAGDVSQGYSQGPGGFYRQSDRSGPYSINASGEAVLIGGGVGGDTSAIGDPSDEPWDGEAPNPSLISIMKACYLQLVTIAENTGA